MESSNKYTVAIDLGESNVVVVVGSKRADGLIAINEIVMRPCEGVKGGMIENIALVEESIKGAVTEIERKLNIRILEAYAGISGEFVRFACHSDHVYVTDPQNGVSQSDVNALFERMKHVQAPDNETIMERIPQNYVVDEAKEVKNPVGSFGRRLSSTFNFILCGNTPMQRLENALRRLGISIIRSYPNALAVADSVLTPDEKEEGVVVVNIGGGLTDVTIYYKNVVRYIVSIPMGAISINHDIRSMMIPDKYIETLKRDYGSAVADMVPENKGIRVRGRTPREAKYILLYNLAVAIEARMSMLVEFVKREIKDSGYEDKLPYGIVLTGGSANLKNIDELFKRMTDMEVRIGKPMEGICDESLAKVDFPEFATAIGILIRGVEQGACATGDNAPFEIEEDEEYEKMSPSEPSVEEPAKEEPKVTPQRVVPKPSQPYTPPEPRPYTPPKRVVESPKFVEETPVQKVEEQSVRPFSVPLSESLSSQPQQEELSEQSVVMEEQSTPQSEPRETSEEVLPKRKNRDWGTIFKRAIDKINDGFNAAEEEEI